MAILTEIRNGVLYATIARLEALNAFDIPDLEELLQLFRNAKANSDVRVLTLTGTGRAFSVGADGNSILYRISGCRHCRALPLAEPQGP